MTDNASNDIEAGTDLTVDTEDDVAIDTERTDDELVEDETAGTAEDELVEESEIVAEADAVEDAAAALPLPEDLRTGMVVAGMVAKLVDFGAFVDIPTQRGTATGLVHVSEVAPGFVENIYAEVGEGDQVAVKVLTIGDDGKIGLSIKQARQDWEELQELDKPVRSKIDKDFDRKLRKFMHGSQSIQGEARRQKRRKLGR